MENSPADVKHDVEHSDRAKMPPRCRGSVIKSKLMVQSSLNYSSIA
jgi:hypothetical protein